MIWKSFGKAELVSLINETIPGLIEKIGDILPHIISDNVHLNIGQSTTLARIAESFAPSDVFSDAVFRRAILQRVDEGKLRSIYEGVIGDRQVISFEKMVDDLVSSPVSRLVFTLVSMKELSERYLTIDTQIIAGAICVVPPSEDEPTAIVCPFRQLLDYQYYLYLKAYEVLKVPKSRAILQMPTGSGKTRTAMELISAYFNESSSCTIIWLAHGEELCDQAVDSFESVYSHLARNKVNIIRNWGGIFKGKLPSQNLFIVTTYQTLCRGGGILKDLNRSNVRLVVADEAHMAVAPKYKVSIKGLIGNSTSVLGLTATPFRSHYEQNQELMDFFFEKIISSSDHPDHETAQLQERGILAKPKFTIINTDITVGVKKRNSIRNKK